MATTPATVVSRPRSQDVRHDQRCARLLVAVPVLVMTSGYIINVALIAMHRL